MTQNAISLVNIFQSVTKSLIENQQSLNQADVINQDHGNNMVQTFQTISRTLLENEDKTESDALALAARQLLQSSQSDSGKLYAQGLAQAAAQFSGKQVDSQSAVKLLETLVAGGQVAPSPAVDQEPAAEGDLFGSLVNGLMGGKTASATDSGLDMTDLLNAGLAFMQEKQSGGSNINALVKAVNSVSGMGTTPHRTQSTMLVINSFLKAVGSAG